MFEIYQATNKKNGKRYIGVTGAGLKHRRGVHLRMAAIGSMSCPRFYDAIRKYGAESFAWSVLASFALAEFAYHHEFVLVRDLKPEYNVAAGGNRAFHNIPSPKRKPVICLESGEVFASVVVAAKRLKAANVSQCCRGISTTASGLHFQFFTEPWTEVQRLKAIRIIDAAGVERRRKTPIPNIPKKALIRNRPGIPLICLETAEIFPSTVAAAIAVKCDAGSISRACRFDRKNKSVKGLHFAYIKDVGQRMYA